MMLLPSALLALCVSLALVPFAKAGGGLVAYDQAMRLGLTRAWFSQTQLDRSQHQVENAVLHGKQILVLTSAGTLHTMEAETGRTVWIARRGNPKYPSLGPAVSETHVAMVNGSQLFILRKNDGREVGTRLLKGSVGGGPVLTEEHVYVPLLSGKMEGHAIDDSKRSAWPYASIGRIFDAPTASAHHVVWSTDRGYLYVASAGETEARYRFEATGRIAPRPAIRDGVIYASSSSGYVYAIQEIQEGVGTQKWRYSTGEVITRSPAIFGDHAYVTTENSTLHCLNANTGTLVWKAPNVAQLVGASKSRVYGLDRSGNLTLFDKATGLFQGRLATSGSTSAILNNRSDRLYLMSRSGLIQCLHEIDSVEPFLHDEQPAEAEPEKKPDGPAPAEKEPEDLAKEAPADEADPFGGEADDEDPFGAGDPFEF